MNIIRIPYEKQSKDDNPYSRSLAIRDQLVNEYGLVENRDFDCHYSSALKVIELRCYAVQESVKSLIALRYTQ